MIQARYINDKFFGYVDELNNPGGGLLLNPGTYDLHIASSLFGDIRQKITIEANKVTVIPLKKETIKRMRALIVAGALALGAYAGDWPRFRGPNGSGVAQTTGLPEKFARPDRNVIWKTALPAPGIPLPW